MVEDAARLVLGRSIGIDDGAVRAALDPIGFVLTRQVIGGPAPAAMNASLDLATRRLADDRAWLDGTRAHLAAAGAERAGRASRLTAGA
jgi:argininosuccinate lyase